MPGKNLKIPMANLEELNALWDADPAKRLPTLHSRRQWAEARNLDVNPVHRWWRDQRFKAKRNHLWVSEESYDIPVGTPPIINPEDQLPTNAAMDSISVTVKKESLSDLLIKPARITRARARVARETGMTTSSMSRSSPEPFPSSSPPSLFDGYSSYETPPSSPLSPETTRTPGERGYNYPNDKIFELSLPESQFLPYDADALKEEVKTGCTLGIEGVEGYTCQLCSTGMLHPFIRGFG
jgi:hypothetical protein